MQTSSRRVARLRHALSAAVGGLMVVCVAAAPAHAVTVRERQWHLDAMHAEEMWETTTGRGITVAVIDSGVDKTVADLRGQVLDGMDYSGQGGDEKTDQAGHGTGMAALIAATGARGRVNGSYGLAPGVKVLPVKMPYATDGFRTKSSRASYSAAMVKAIRFAADSNARVINVSMGSPNTSGMKNVGTPELDAAVKYALGKGKLIFAAAGNDGDITNAAEYPAATPGVVGVAAVDDKAKPLKDSQWGPQVDLAAPGKDLIRACAGGTQLCGGSGTSGASALASASAALIWSQHPDWTNNQVLRVLMRTAGGNDKGLGRDDVVGYGVVRPRIALKNPGDPGPAGTYPIPGFSYDDARSPSPEPSQQKTAGDRATIAPSASSDDGNATGLWIAGGSGAAVVLGAAVAAPVVRSRSRSRSRSRRDAASAPGFPAPPQRGDHPHF
ncbi:type VII secretion-associated serine protease mycosin [Streptomyces sp. NPDC006208]|uniref:type VII secretion-associated serine protease mycosin n=1 Tax=Streptomyces sp. NPDC006208 TaxID=3156734 RepID=UPI0033BB19A4